MFRNSPKFFVVAEQTQQVSTSSFFVFKFLGQIKDPRMQQLRIAAFILVGFAVFWCILMIVCIVCRLLLVRSASIKSDIGMNYESR